jgi:hypothetical protein
VRLKRLFTEVMQRGDGIEPRHIVTDTAFDRRLLDGFECRAQSFDLIMRFFGAYRITDLSSRTCRLSALVCVVYGNVRSRRCSLMRSSGTHHAMG